MKKIITLVSLFLIFITTNAQKYFGLNQSNYSGTQGMMYNPAKIATNRNSFALELFSVNAYANNSVFKMNKDSLINGKLTTINTGNNQNISIVAPLLEVRLPSVCLSLTDKLAIGVSTRVRFFNQVHNANSNVMSIYTNAYNGSSTSINDPVGFNYNIHALSDLGFTGAYKLLDLKPFKVTAGGSIRLYKGNGYFNFYNSGIVGNYTSGAMPNDLSVSQIGIHLSTSAYDFQKVIDDYNTPKKALNNMFGNGGAGKGIGFDWGGEIIFNDNNMQENIEDRKGIKIKNAYKPYRLKLGISMLDIGAIKYDNVKQLNIKGSGSLNTDSISSNLQSFTGLARYFNSRGFHLDSATVNGVKSNLPTTLNIYGDFCFTKNLFISASYMQNMVDKTSASPFYYSQFTVAPRLESKAIDITAPISYNTMSKDVKLGLAFRLGPLSVGSDDMSLLFSNSKGGNIYAGLRLALNKKQKSKSSKIVTEETTTKTTKINNKIETRNNTKTIVEKRIDTVNKVIEKIVNITNDKDKDGIVDSLDRCPNEFGTLENKGCPEVEIKDRDKDGVLDVNDECPDVFGLKEFNGCPDRDGDKVVDSKDKCPDVPGVIALNGCPDRDGDGVADYEDKCPDTKGLMSNNGCPEVKQEIKKRIAFAAKAIQFETAKSTLKEVSFVPLNEVVKILNEYTDYNLTIDGHTDNVGSASSNMILSQNRANAVKAYFVSKGISESRLTATGYGLEKPKVPNTTVENKAINRRVEMELKVKD